MIDPMQDPKRPSYFIGGAADESPAEQVLRKLACWLGAGGYNADTVDADVFHDKIVWGVENAIRGAKTQAQQPEQQAPWREMIEDTKEVFDYSSPETPQTTRDVIEYVKSWLEVYEDKTARLRALAGRPLPSSRRELLELATMLHEAAASTGLMVSLQQVDLDALDDEQLRALVLRLQEICREGCALRPPRGRSARA